jgi:hypothetical protein
MKRKFFIYSLPRSGSSWLSQFLSMPGSYCYHEPFADNTLQGILDKMEVRPEPCVGLIDTSAHQRVVAHLSNCNYFVLRRDLKDVESSLKLKGWVMCLSEENRKLNLVAGLNECIEIHYRWLDDIVYLRNLWASIVGTPFDQERAEYLIEMRIQREFASVKRRFDRAASSHD